MARKEEMPIVHPRKALKALGGFHDDVGYLLSVARNACRFLEDGSLDAEKTRKVVGDQLKEAAARFDKWYDTE